MRQTLYGIYGSFVPSRLHLRLPDEIREYRGTDEEPASAARSATIVHEQAHYFQTLFTGYGQIMWQMHRQATSFALTEWRKITDGAERRRLPLAHLAQSGRREFAHSLLIDTTVDEWMTLQLARWGMKQVSLRIRDLRMKLLDAPWYVNPTRPVNGASTEFRGKDILESHAQYTEGVYLRHAEEIPLDLTFDPKHVSKTYWGPWVWFKEQCPGREADFPYVCDLALQTTATPLLPTNEHEWRATAPAWRFVLLVEKLRELDLRTGPVAEVGSWYPQYANALLDACGFASLETTLNERLEVFTRRPELTVLETTMRDALKWRLEHLSHGANPIDDPLVWNALTQRFRIPVVEAAGKLGTTDVGNQSLMNEIAQELQFQAMALQILGDISEAARSEKALECAYAKFSIAAGCPYQITHACSGRFVPTNGIPHPVTTRPDGTLDGCQFGMLLDAMSIEATSLDFDPAAKFPPLP